MGKREKKSNIASAFILLRRGLIFLIIVAVAALALFWESLPTSVKNIVTSLSAEQFDGNDDLIPPRFRAEKNADILDNISRHSPQLSQPPSSAQLFDKEIISSGTKDDAKINNELLVKLHNELMQMGATACQLTYWGDKGNMYRFSCQVPVSDRRPNVTRTFQSIAPDAAQSMQEVVGQVKQWHLEH